VVDGVNLFRVLNVDHVGPFKVGHGFRYILTVRDHATLFSWFIPVKTKTTKEAAEALAEHCFCLTGYPIMIRSDQGFGEVGDESLGKYLQTYGVYHVPTMPYSPQANWLVEVLHKPLRKILVKFAENSKWLGLVPYLNWIARTTPYEILGNRSSYEVVFGCKPRHAFSETLRTAFGGSSGVDSYLAEANRFRELILKASDASRTENNRLRGLAQLKLHGHSVESPLVVGDLVVVRNRGARKDSFDPKNFSALFRVSRVGARFAVLSDLHGQPAVGAAKGKVPLHLLTKAVPASQSHHFLQQLDHIPTTNEMLGRSVEAFSTVASVGNSTNEGSEESL